MTGLELYMESLAVRTNDKLTELQEKYDRNFSKEPGGHVAFVSAAGRMVPPLITIARASRALMTIHQDTPEGYRLRDQIHRALREIENA